MATRKFDYAAIQEIYSDMNKIIGSASDNDSIAGTLNTLDKKVQEYIGVCDEALYGPLANQLLLDWFNTSSNFPNFIENFNNWSQLVAMSGGDYAQFEEDIAGFREINPLGTYSGGATQNFVDSEKYSSYTNEEIETMSGQILAMYAEVGDAYFVDTNMVAYEKSRKTRAKIMFGIQGVATILSVAPAFKLFGTGGKVAVEGAAAGTKALTTETKAIATSGTKALAAETTTLAKTGTTAAAATTSKIIGTDAVKAAGVDAAKVVGEEVTEVAAKKTGSLASRMATATIIDVEFKEVGTEAAKAGAKGFGAKMSAAGAKIASSARSAAAGVANFGKNVAAKVNKSVIVKSAKSAVTKIATPVKKAGAKVATGAKSAASKIVTPIKNTAAKATKAMESAIVHGGLADDIVAAEKLNSSASKVAINGVTYTDADGLVGAFTKGQIGYAEFNKGFKNMFNLADDAVKVNAYDYLSQEFAKNEGFQAAYMLGRQGITPIATSVASPAGKATALRYALYEFGLQGTKSVVRSIEKEPELAENGAVS